VGLVMARLEARQASRTYSPTPGTADWDESHRRSPMSYAYSAPVGDIDLTSILDGRTHAVSAADFDAGIWQGRGRYRARCGIEVLAAALVTGPGPRCGQCPSPREEATRRRIKPTLRAVAEFLTSANKFAPSRRATP
jgi:hypothetical protein